MPAVCHLLSPLQAQWLHSAKGCSLESCSAGNTTAASSIRHRKRRKETGTSSGHRELTSEWGQTLPQLPQQPWNTRVRRQENANSGSTSKPSLLFSSKWILPIPSIWFQNMSYVTKLQTLLLGRTGAEHIIKCSLDCERRAEEGKAVGVVRCFDVFGEFKNLAIFMHMSMLSFCLEAASSQISSLHPPKSYSHWRGLCVSSLLVFDFASFTLDMLLPNISAHSISLAMQYFK